jgi:hypothetical protein
MAPGRARSRLEMNAGRNQCQDSEPRLRVDEGVAAKIRPSIFIGADARMLSYVSIFTFINMSRILRRRTLLQIEPCMQIELKLDHYAFYSHLPRNRWPT